MNKFYIPGITFGVLFVGIAGQASAVTINFDDQGFTGPSIFADAGVAQTLNIPTTAGNVKFEGGVILKNTTTLPANQTSLYGTASFGEPSLTNLLMITFDNPINNFSLNVFNGSSEDTSYTVADNAGNSSTFTLPPNVDSGRQQFGFATTGTEVTIKSVTDSLDRFDFFIDDISFNKPLPPGKPVPEPIFSPVVPLVLAAGLGTWRWKKRKTTLI
ncbi:hypothetical protein WKK05_00975 [Nostoc sp. UHCC 0302]|uniref:hypothetical protein n=1 Tax=Nostoc sp. UHCC 0302 TaxID=3134896 RepID=UPI00311CCE66